jgi:uncharacterized membrane protein HdeD (DUF308 family)
MITTLAAKNWGMFVLRGVLAIVLGVLAFTAPGPTLAAIVLVFAAYAIVDGILAVAAGVALPVGPRWLLIIGGVIAIAVGVYTLFNPDVTATALVYLIAAFAIVRGGSEIAAAISLRQFVQNAPLLGVSGVLSIVFGVLLFASPGSGALAVLWIVGFYALVIGGMYVYLGFRLRTFAKRVDSATSQTGPAPTAVS